MNMGTESNLKHIANSCAFVKIGQGHILHAQYNVPLKTVGGGNKIVSQVNF